VRRWWTYDRLYRLRQRARSLERRPAHRELQREVAAGAAAPQSNGPQLQPSVSFVYSNGTDKDILERREKYMITLGMKF